MKVVDILLNSGYSEKEALQILGRPIAFHVSFVKAFGTVEAAIFLSQAIYWSTRNEENGGWFSKSQEQWENETALSPRTQMTARKRLISFKVLEEKYHRLDHKFFYRVDPAALYSHLFQGLSSEMDIDQILHLYGRVLRGLSKVALMRAKKTDTKAKYVDFITVLRNSGLLCNRCGKSITRGPGQKRGDLTFDHIIPLNRGGLHEISNIKPAHAECNISYCDGKRFPNLYAKDSGEFTLDNPEPLVKPFVLNLKEDFKKKKKEIPLPLEATELSQLLSDRIFENFPKRTAPTEVQLTEWAREADRIRRIDGHSWAEIRSLLGWSQGDQFWRSNILSMQKFRKQWNQLLAQRERAGRDPKADALRRRTEEILKAGL